MLSDNPSRDGQAGAVVRPTKKGHSIMSGLLNIQKSCLTFRGPKFPRNINNSFFLWHFCLLFTLDFFLSNFLGF